MQAAALATNQRYLPHHLAWHVTQMSTGGGEGTGGTDHGLTKCPVPQFELLGGKVIGANALRQNVSLSANGHFV
jgi:hypothetical protein